jgi:hypothetical protein
VVEHLFSKALNANSSTTKKQKRGKVTGSGEDSANKCCQPSVNDYCQKNVMNFYCCIIRAIWILVTLLKRQYRLEERYTERHPLGRGLQHPAGMFLEHSQQEHKSQFTLVPHLFFVFFFGGTGV